MSDVTLHLGDCLEIVQTLADGSIDAVITDPPYCSGAHESAKRTKSAGKTPESVKDRPVIQSDSMGTHGFEWIFRRLFLDLRHKTKQGGHLACFTDWRMLPQFGMLIEAAGWRWNNVIVWDKGYAGLGRGFRAQHEMIILASNGAPTWHSWDFGNVLKSMRMTKTEHPHQKPIDLFEPLFRTCTEPGATILDPFMGSGSTGVACVKEGRNFIGIDLDKNYFDIAQRRIAEAQMQLPLLEAV